MKLIEAQNFVIKNGRYLEQASENSHYYVRFPYLHSPKVLFANEPSSLVEKVFAFGKTQAGKELWSRIPVGKYLVVEIEDRNMEEPEEEYS